MKNIILYHLASLFPRINKQEKAHEVAKQELRKAKGLVQEITKTAKTLAGLKFLGAYFRIPDVTRKLRSLEAQLKSQTDKCELWAQRAGI